MAIFGNTAACNTCTCYHCGKQGHSQRFCNLQSNFRGHGYGQFVGASSQHGSHFAKGKLNITDGSVPTKQQPESSLASDVLELKTQMQTVLNFLAALSEGTSSAPGRVQLKN